MKKPLSRFSLTEWSLIISNMIPLVGIFGFGWDALVVLFLYWLETAVIGLFALLRMAKAAVPPPGKRGESDGVDFDTMVPKRYRLFMMGFFVIHFGIFMSVHLGMIVAIFHDGRYGSVPEFFAVNGIAVLAMVVPLFLSHLFSYITKFIGGKEYAKTDTTKEMMRPYGRVLLVHIIAFCGAFLGPVVLLFGKTLFDLMSHRRSHRKFIINTTV